MKSLRVSPEYDGLDHEPGEPMREVIERRILSVGVDSYLTYAYDYLHALDAFDDVHLVKDAIDESHGDRSGYGRLFLDGGVLALDWLDMYAPRLVPKLHDRLGAYERSVRRKYLRGYASEEDHLAYVYALRKRGETSARNDFAHNYARVIDAVAVHRGHRSNESTPQFAVLQGAGYVLKAAELAHTTDIMAFGRKVISDLITQTDDDNDHELADMIIREAHDWDAKDRDQAA